MPGKKIVVVGGGFGGTAAAITLRSKLDIEHEVLLFDKNKRTFLCGSLPSLVVGERQSTKISRSLGSLKKRGIEHIQSTVNKIDLSAKTVTSHSGTFDYDYLVLSPGAKYDWNAVPGSKDNYSFYDIDSARKLRRKLASFRKGTVVIAVSSMPYKCPPAPFEAAMMMEWYFQKQKIRKDVNIHVYTPEPMPLAVAGPQAASNLISDLGKKGIQVTTHASVVEINDNRQVCFDNGSEVNADLIITVPKHVAPRLVKNAGLVGPSGWVDVASDNLMSNYDSVYAIGDVNNVAMANGRGLPKAGVFASSGGNVVGHNIAARILDWEPKIFPGIGECFIGFGGNMGGIVRGDFLAETKPNVKYHRPSRRGYLAKEKFENKWRRFRI